MKKISTLLIGIGLSFTILNAQEPIPGSPPQGFSYKATIVRSTGAVVASRPVGIQIRIYNVPSDADLYEYTETFTPTTNEYGQIDIIIGRKAGFSALDWSKGPYYLEVKVDVKGGTNYQLMSTTQLLSVPYALYAGAAGSANGAVTITGDQTITGIKTFSKDLFVSGLTVGRGTNSIPRNTALGYQALNTNTTGGDNIAIGYQALWKNTTGVNNIANGNFALNSNTTGQQNTAFGNGALSSNTTASNNTAIGHFALSSNETGVANTAIGVSALGANKNGYGNTATGHLALMTNTTGIGNTANGNEALFANTTGWHNTANGYQALWKNETGSNNTAIGTYALHANTTGGSNTANGRYSLFSNTTGTGNTVVGDQAGYENITGSYNVFIGFAAGRHVDGSNKLIIDNKERVDESDAKNKSLIYGEFAEIPANQNLAINATLSMQNRNVTNLATPVNAQDAATKAYVDELKTTITVLTARIAALESGGTGGGGGGTGTVTDIEGNVYNTVIIGTQTWMAENLKTTKYNDGTAIPLVTKNYDWGINENPAYCWYNNDATTDGTIYGALYNWYAVSSGKLCPSGWHIPTDAEWYTLVLTIDPNAQLIDNGIESSIAASKLKESGTSHWINPDTGATNETGFTALPSGFRSNDGTYNDIGVSGFWWSSYEYSLSGAIWHMSYDNSDVIRRTVIPEFGFSVRCLLDL